MNLTIKYFGLLAEVTGRSEENITFSEESLDQLLDSLYFKYPELKSKDFQLAYNNEIVSKDTKLNDGEIALLPPFSGG